jgi:ABC-type glycerol-3-phosphate transport system substrate-binding protein
MKRRRIAMTVAVAIGLAGCGSSSSSSSSSITPAQYRTSVDKLCAAYNASVRALPKSTTASIAGLTTLANSAKNALAQIKTVPPPSAIKAGVNKWLADLEQSEANVAKLLDAFKSGDTTELRSLAAQGTKLNTQGNAQAQALGLPSCAENATPGG